MRLNRIHCADDLVVQQDELIFIRGTRVADPVLRCHCLDAAVEFGQKIFHIALNAGDRLCLFRDLLRSNFQNISHCICILSIIQNLIYD